MGVKEYSRDTIKVIDLRLKLNIINIFDSVGIMETTPFFRLRCV